jgi:hypothetical protein
MKGSYKIFNTDVNSSGFFETIDRRIVYTVTMTGLDQEMMQRILVSERFMIQKMYHF